MKNDIKLGIGIGIGLLILAFLLTAASWVLRKA